MFIFFFFGTEQKNQSNSNQPLDANFLAEISEVSIDFGGLGFFFSAKTKSLINDAASRSLLRYQHSCSGGSCFSFRAGSHLRERQAQGFED